LKCRWIDETHTKIGSEIYHICQWAETCERNGNTYEAASKQERKIDILAAKYGDDLQAVTVSMTEAAIKKLVGGKYDVSPLFYQNGAIAAALVRGTAGIAVCGIADGTLTNLHPYNAQKYKRELSPATYISDRKMIVTDTPACI
jgi:hypothetical protein